ncbi:MAG: (Fe-S)-binding protein [Armatimonadota bacterium]|nr:(Fe-S)-binding protein [Armatimonadota bacterium]MDR7467305.1 (Fe-S)-binding protein [Armatimonadota bacterium]MDR7494566.1 (Fe-S)-binding protein [Armatimonadota bacterium]MDR7504467.1 (Fe-S)-binding protein [Armatimonadota bacterium]MDR7558384.1 (Fe-S)-binding protein [Armatimonadota bacterium]
MRAALFVTCLVDQLFPRTGRAAEDLLRHLGVTVEFPPGQTCCGQVAFNDGFWSEARPLARRLLGVFDHADAVVAPSASCVAMIREFYPILLRDDPARAAQAREVGRRTYELTEFLVDVLGVVAVGAHFPHRVAYHPACHGLRLLGLREQPLRLLRHVRELDLRPLVGAEECCGFGGMFALKFAELSAAMLETKLRAIEASGAEFVTATDVSCLMHIDGGLRRRRSAVGTIPIAEILAAR